MLAPNAYSVEARYGKIIIRCNISRFRLWFAKRMFHDCFKQKRFAFEIENKKARYRAFLFLMWNPRVSRDTSSEATRLHVFQSCRITSLRS
jgi:hypothetical protein